MKELEKTGARSKRAAAEPGAHRGDSGLLAVYHQWDEAKFATILARPNDPAEKDELATITSSRRVHVVRAEGHRRRNRGRSR